MDTWGPHAGPPRDPPDISGEVAVRLGEPGRPVGGRLTRPRTEEVLVLDEEHAALNEWLASDARDRARTPEGELAASWQYDCDRRRHERSRPSARTAPPRRGTA